MKIYLFVIPKVREVSVLQYTVDRMSSMPPTLNKLT